MSFADASLLARISFGMIAVSLLLLQLAVYQAKVKKFHLHYPIMGLAITVNGLFLVTYIIRYITRDETHFEGPLLVRNFIYFPILILHIVLSIYVIYKVAIFAPRSYKILNRSEKGNVYFKDKDYREYHRKVGRRLHLLWSLSFVGGITIFIMLYLIPWN